MSDLKILLLALLAGSSMGFFGGAGCTSGDHGEADPKRRLSDYISKSFAVRGPEDRKEMEAYLRGDAQTRLSAWSDEQFRVAFVDAKRQFIKLVFDEVKNISPHEVDITYELSYLDQTRGHDAKVTNKKLCQLVLDQGQWFIADVKNLKELVEYKDEMALP